ncbi:type I-D CRISPR-associated endonuclease Cas1d [Methanosarcina sp. 2.H.A.1B.4]|uniref:type I-D CRISPR-associated endonuclease Cas1d n=1 Tax=Methanosarcina sp. 2.H.A.1B.4 TaxID=1483600 RepID=UPI0006216254|nr:type I-D CRISPR-associated endonuclease Cas1d [Methanosarcina sp. 2.H.A.1B.4]KKG11221.1 CRISPR-associated protein Cas1 [Methanosarcina sp. 2.H.A.1B.4]
MKASEGILDDDVIYVTKQGSTVGVDGGRISVYQKEEGELASYPIGKVSTINIFGNVNFTTPFVAQANEHGVTLNYFNFYGKYRGSFIPERNTIAEVRRKQYALTDSQCLVISQRMISGKIRNSKTLLSRKGIKDLNKLDELDSKTYEVENLDKLRGYEGEAAEFYFGHLNGCLIDGWTFEKRTKRPPEDHINALMSLTYTMMKNEVLSSLRQYNLDPYLGIFHADRHGKPALALDLMEEFRPIFCDAFVLRLINRKELTHDDFQVDNHLKEHPFKTYLAKFDEYMKEEFMHPYFKYQVSRRKAVRMQAILLRKAITNELPMYYPLVFRR